MKLLHVKIARFTDIVAKCGAPEVLALWIDPKDDKDFQRALRDERIMSVHQPAVGTKKDFGEIGFVRGPNVSYLRFPKSLKRYSGQRVVGVDYALLDRPKVGDKFRANARGSKKTSSPRRPKPHDTFKPAPARDDAERSRKARPPTADRTPAKPAPRAVDPVPIKDEPPVDPFMSAAIAEARKGLKEGGIPIGAALTRDGKLVAVGHNKRVQDNDPVTHAETDCLRNAGRLGSFRGCVLYSTLMPCFFCAGAAVQFGIKKIVVGESRNFPGAAEFLREHNIEVVDLDLLECRQMMARFIREHPKLWHEDIGR